MSEAHKTILEDLDFNSFNQNFENYDRKTSIFCAQLSSLAYWGNSNLAEFWKTYNSTFPESNTHFKLIEEPRSHTQVLLWGNKDNLIIAFRGTEASKWRDWWTDLKFKVYKNKPEFDEALAFLPAGSAGFRKALMNLLKHNDFYAEIDAMIGKCNPETNNNTFPIYLTGHSLGAALSQLFMESLHKKGYTFSGAYHFAPPLAVSKKLNSYMKSTHGKRVHDIVNHNDYIPRAGRMGVAHFGIFYRIHENGLMQKEKERYIKFNKNEYLKEFEYHSMANHLKHVKNIENTNELIQKRSQVSPAPS